MPQRKSLKTKFKRKGRFHVYIVECSDGTYYTGSTGDLLRRIEMHNKGKGAKYLRGRRPVELVYTRSYRYFKSAVNAEREIKQLSRREKEALVSGMTDLNGFYDMTLQSRNDIVKSGLKKKVPKTVN